MKLPSGVKLSGPLSSIFTGAVSRQGVRCIAFFISGSNCSQSSSSSWNWKVFGMGSMRQGLATGSKPPISSPPTSSL